MIDGILSPEYCLVAIALIATVTLLTRVLPFWIFRPGKPVPKAISYLGKVMPPAIIGMLVVYCLKDVNPFAAPFALPELIAIACVVALYVWKRNTLISIGVGTVAYMLLVQFVF